MSNRQYITVERYGRRKWDAVLVHGNRVIERTSFPSRREAMQFIRLLERAGMRYMPDARGGSPVDPGFVDEPNGPIGVGLNGEYLWADTGPVESIDLDLDSIDADSIPF